MAGEPAITDDSSKESADEKTGVKSHFGSRMTPTVDSTMQQQLQQRNSKMRGESSRWKVCHSWYCVCVSPSRLSGLIAPSQQWMV